MADTAPSPLPSNRPQDAKAPDRADVMARDALVLALLGFIPVVGMVCSAAAVFEGIVSLVRRTSRKNLAIAGILLGFAVPAAEAWLFLDFGPRYIMKSASKVHCGANLYSLGQAMAMYRSENQGAWPSDLEVLLKIGAIPSRKSFQCPSAGSGRECDYFYLPPAPSAPNETIVACDLTADNHRGEGRNVVYVTTNIRRMTEPDFQAELARPHNARFAAALRAAEGKLAVR